MTRVNEHRESKGQEATFRELDTSNGRAIFEDGTRGPTSAPELPPEELQRRTVASKKLAVAFGEIVSVLMRSESHRTQMLMDLEWLVLPVIASGQFKIAGAQSKTIGYLVPVAVVMWARVSPEVDKRLAANLQQPVRLKPAEWMSGDIHWLVEAVGDPRVVGPMLKSLAEKEWNGQQVKFRSRGEKGEAVVRVIDSSKADQVPVASERSTSSGT